LAAPDLAAPAGVAAAGGFGGLGGDRRDVVRGGAGRTVRL